MKSEDIRNARLQLLAVIGEVREAREPFVDAIYHCAQALQAPTEEERRESLQWLTDRLMVRELLFQALASSVVAAAYARGFGTLTYPEAAVAIGEEEFQRLLQSYTEQIRKVMV